MNTRKVKPLGLLPKTAGKMKQARQGMHGIGNSGAGKKSLSRFGKGK